MPDPKIGRHQSGLRKDDDQIGDDSADPRMPDLPRIASALDQDNTDTDDRDTVQHGKTGEQGESGEISIETAKDGLCLDLADPDVIRMMRRSYPART